MDAALASLRNQGMGNDLEVIVQDADVEPDEGQADALNKGFAKANGEWLFWLNADDVLLPGALKRIVRLFDCSEISTDRRSLCEAKSLEWCSIAETVSVRPSDEAASGSR